MSRRKIYNTRNKSYIYLGGKRWYLDDFQSGYDGNMHCIHNVEECIIYTADADNVFCDIRG